jgi:hypothetical protein
MKCPTCGEEHELLDPVFSRPDVVFAMSPEEKSGRVMENDDICALRGNEGDLNRYFVRCTLPVRLLDSCGDTCWGLWAEVSEADSKIIWDAWDDPEQEKIAPIDARIANRIPGYLDTTNLAVSLRLTGPTSRPQLSLPDDSLHPFVRECLGGVCTHRVMEWLAGMAGASGAG